MEFENRMTIHLEVETIIDFLSILSMMPTDLNILDIGFEKGAAINADKYSIEQNDLVFHGNKGLVFTGFFIFRQRDF